MIMMMIMMMMFMMTMMMMKDKIRGDYLLGSLPSETSLSRAALS